MTKGESVNPNDITPAKAKEIREAAKLSRAKLSELWRVSEVGVKGKEMGYNGNAWTGRDQFAYWALWKLLGRKK